MYALHATEWVWALAVSKDVDRLATGAVPDAVDVVTVVCGRFVGISRGVLSR